MPSATPHSPTKLDKIPRTESNPPLAFPEGSINCKDVDAMNPLRILDLDIPTALVDEVEQLRRTLRLTGNKEKREFDENVRLRIHFGGKGVLCLRTANGTVVLASADADSREISTAMWKLTPEERSRSYLDTPAPWGVPQQDHSLL